MQDHTVTTAYTVHVNLIESSESMSPASKVDHLIFPESSEQARHVDPVSATLAQHWTSICTKSRVCSFVAVWIEMCVAYQLPLRLLIRYECISPWDNDAVNTRFWPHFGLKLAYHLRCWSNIKPAPENVLSAVNTQQHKTSRQAIKPGWHVIWYISIINIKNMFLSCLWSMKCIRG